MGNRIFQYHLLFLVAAVGTWKVTFPKPEGFARRPRECGQSLSEVLFAFHPPALFLGSVLVNNSDLIFVPVVVRHISGPIGLSLIHI